VVIHRYCITFLVCTKKMFSYNQMVIVLAYYAI